MTEPVGYLVKNRQTTITRFSYEKGDDKKYKNTPLYTLEQLHPRVKMTRSEFDRFEEITSKYDFISQAINSIGFIGNEKEIFENEIRFVKIFMIFHENKQEELIEIVPDMKWFVRSKEKEQGFYLFLSDIKDVKDHWYHTPRKDDTEFALSFDTKEQAELWTNPLTEAVQLPVEDD